MARNSQYTLLVFMILFGKVRGLAFVTEPNNTVVAFTGFNQTFTWTLNLTEEDKSKELKVRFGPWNKKYGYVRYFLMAFVREPSGKENEVKVNHSTAKRLYWTGDLSRDNYIAFQLVNIKRDDSGDYGIRIRVDYFPPKILEGWFTLTVQDPPVKPTVGLGGGWSNWNAWGICSVTCGGGSQTRHRTCTNPPPRLHLLYCQGSRFQSRLCNTNNCPIHGGWSDWNEWSLCTKANGGIQIRTRECVNPKPRYGGKSCSGNRVFARECGNTSSCHEAFPVRFRTEEIPSLGTMEIFENKTWEKLCTASWDDAEENLTCRAMGYFNNGPNENSTGQDGRNGSNTTVHHSCRSMTHDCVNNSKDDQKCKVPVRLNGANIEYGGRVEVFYRGKWGKICRKEWDLNDVKVVCNQLGFKGALAEFIASEVKEEKIPYLMSKVSCSGQESDLASCKRIDGDYDCPDDKGAQALCEPKNREVLEKKSFVSDIGNIEIFQCSLSNDTSMTKWYVKGAPVSLSGRRVKASGGRLFINNVQLSDGGTYECRGLKYTRFYTIYVNAIFKDTPIRQTLISGTSAILKCSAVGTPIPQFDEWKKDGIKTLDEGRFTQMSNGNLRVYPVRLEDQGNYTCAMKQNKGKERITTKYRTIHVSVVDGGWSDWKALGTCTVTCGGGLQTFHRTCTNPPPGIDGRICRRYFYYDTQTRSCNTNNCPIHGVWSDWSEWSLCTKAIGGIQVRARECVNPKPRYGGKPCSGNRVVVRECGNTSSCHEDFPVRFRTEEIPSLGTMEIFKNKTWEKLCTASWDDADDNLTCRAMGYFNNGPNEKSTGQDGRNGSNTTVHLNCRSMTDDCLNHTKDDLQKCKVPVRLNGANIEYGGRVEVFYRGKWGKICRKEWGLDDAKVVCNQLGFKGALAEFIASEVKEENIPYLMSKVSCSGHESDLASCKRTDGDYDCPDDKGAQALCEPKNREVLEKKTFVSDIGNIETFHCSLPNDTSMTKWYVKGADASLSGGRIKSSRGKLTISNVQLSDGGTYECRGLKYTRFYTIYVNAIFKDTPIRQTLISGTSDILKCSAVGTPTPQFDEWKKDGIKTLDEGRFTQMSNGNLRVNPVWPEDQGNYTCAMKQNKGKERITTKYRTIHVSVVVPPNVQMSEPKLTVQEGENVSLTCVINEGTTPKIQWYKDESPIDGKKTVLHLTEVTAEDEGRYTCKAENEGGSSNDSTFVTVDVPPKVNRKMMNQSVPLSSSFVMKCIVGGDPSPKVNWTKNGRHLANNSTTLHIRHVTFDDAGQYGCSAENRAGKIHKSFWMDVTVSPQVYVSPTNQTAHEGKATNISCKVTSGVPKPSLSWTFEGGPLPEEVFEIEIENGSVLQMQHTTKGMEGTYKCVAENKANKAIAYSTLRVLEKPTAEIRPDSYPPFLVGDKLILTCKVSGKRVEVKWKKNGSPVTPKARISQDSDESTLLIENVETGDGGDYSCEAHNDAGFSKSSTVEIKVRVERPVGKMVKWYHIVFPVAAFIFLIFGVWYIHQRRMQVHMPTLYLMKSRVLMILSWKS